MAGDISKPVYGEVWASTGEKLSPGLIKIQDGWIQEMMPFQYENWIQNRQDVAISYLLQKGVVEWTAEQECIANKTVVTYQGNLYMALVDSMGVLPTVTANWKRLNSIGTADGVVGIAGGGTGATTAANARTNLGLGSIATQNVNSVAITGGSINGTSIGATTPSTGAFTTVNASGTVTAAGFVGNITGNVVGNADTVTNGVYTVGNQSIAGNKTFSGVTAVTNTTVSTNTTTGALTVAGGVGIAGALNVAGGITGSLSGNATSANVLSTGRTIALSGGVTGTPTNFNGSANITIPVTAIDASVISGTASMDIGGNAGTATKLQNPRTIALSGAATGTATAFDGSGNISIPVTALNATNLTTGSVPEDRMSAFAVTKTGATGSAKLPAGTNAQRDASPAPGYFRFNTSVNIPEFWNGTTWMTSTGTDLAGLIGTGPSQVPTNAIASGNYLPKSNAAMIGVPTAPTAAEWDNTTQVATTAFVERRVASTAVPYSADLNTYTREGDYFCYSNATAATVVNAPAPYAFAMNVRKANSTGNNGVIQTLTTYHTDNIRKIYQRASEWTGTWGLWTRIYTEIDPPTDLDNLNLKSINSGALNGDQDKIINGDMSFDQRNFGNAVVLSGTSAGITDRWYVATRAGATISAQRAATTASSSRNCLAITVTSGKTTAASDRFSVLYYVEGYDCADWWFGTSNAKTVTLSFETAHSIAGVYSVAFYNADANRSYVATYTQSVANAWEKQSITLQADTTGTWAINSDAGIIISFDYGTGSTLQTPNVGVWQAGQYIRSNSGVNLISTTGAVFRFTSVSMKQGTDNGPFVPRSFAKSISLIQRYYEVCGFVMTSDGPVYKNVFFKQTKRANPVLTLRSGTISPGILEPRGTSYFSVNGSAGSNNPVAVVANSEYF